MKTERIIGIIWLICGVLYLFQGLNYLYKYSTPNALWFVMIPIVLTYTKIICGILCLKIGTEFFKRKSENHYLILPLTFLLILYLTIDLIKYGTSTIYYSGENLLLLICQFIKWKAKSELLNWLKNWRTEAKYLVESKLFGSNTTAKGAKDYVQ